MRPLAFLLLLAAAVHADLVSDVKLAFKRKEPERRVTGLRMARGAISNADRRVRNRAAAAIERALKKEPSPTVRVAAFDFLLALRTGRSLDRLVVAALDKSERVRKHVHDLVRGHADPKLQEAIVRAMREDASWRMRAAMVDLLLAGARASVRRPLLDALDDEHPAVAARAAEALFRLSGKGFGLDKQKWQKWLARPLEGPPKEGERRTVADPLRRVKLHEGPVRGLVPSLYTIPVLRKRAIFVVDMSSSMQHSVRSTHFDELKRVLFLLPSDVLFNVLCFDQRQFFFGPPKGLVPATVANKARVERWLNDLPAGEKTDVNRSVAAGLAMLKEALARAPGVKAELFILTDGRETKRTTSLRAVEAQYQKLPEARCKVHVIALGKHGTPALRTLAEASGGHFVEAPG